VVCRTCLKGLPEFDGLHRSAAMLLEV